MAYKGVPAEKELLTLVDNCNDRGGHSWGCYFKNSKNQLDLLIKGSGFMPFDILKSIYLNFDLCIGISRLSTTYITSLEHSQPFNVAGKYAVHNGVVMSYKGKGLDSLEVFNAIEQGEEIGALIWIENDQIKYHEDLIKIYKHTNKVLISSKKLK